MTAASPAAAAEVACSTELLQKRCAKHHILAASSNNEKVLGAAAQKGRKLGFPRTHKQCQLDFKVQVLTPHRQRDRKHTHTLTDSNTHNQTDCRATELQAVGLSGCHTHAAMCVALAL